ncbi:uncharacterized protein [Watersipora subatra]|uniref:uncharacterized protein n=1 Tax=Watersipora subatra TaxID=2589382 RepID=UPI00355AE920
MNLNQLVNSFSNTANQVGHQVGQYIDGQATGGLLSFFATGNVVCLVARFTGKALQIVASKDGRLVVDALGVEGPQAFNTHWTVVNEGNNVIRLHNNNNYLCINNAQILVIPQVTGVPVGAETKLRVSHPNYNFVTLESVKEPGNFITMNQLGQPLPGAMDPMSRHFVPRLLHSPYGSTTYVAPHSYRL